MCLGGTWNVLGGNNIYLFTVLYGTSARFLTSISGSVFFRYYFLHCFATFGGLLGDFRETCLGTV